MGPMYVKKSSDGEIEMTKVYTALHTCATTRAVHLAGAAGICRKW